MVTLPGRTSVVASVEELVAQIPRGAVVGIGGFVTSNKPMALLRELMRQRRDGLTIAVAAGSLELDLMLALGLANRLITSYAGAESIAAVAPLFAAQAGRQVELEEVDLGTFAQMLRAQALRLPFLPVRGPVGTDLPRLNPRLRPLDDPFGGPPLYAARALALDFALIHAAQADPYGNVQHLGATFLDAMLARAARTVFVEVERLVSNEEIRRRPGDTTLPAALVDRVAVAPYGAHPFASHGGYQLDAGHLSELARVSRLAAQGERAELDAYLARYVSEPSNHREYLERVGLARLLDLALEGGTA